jgi:MFS family permease
MLVIGRAFLGFGIGSCLTTALKSVTIWFPSQFWATANGMILFSGSIGAILSTKPLQIFMTTYHWRDLFLIGFIICFLLLILVIFLMPEKKPEVQSDRESNFYVYMQIIKNKNFYTLAPVSALGLASFFSIQGLWANGWMSDVAGLTQEEIGIRLLIVAIAMSFGTLGNGALVDYLSKRGFNRAKYLDGYWQWVILGLTGNIGVLVHPILNKTYPPGYSARSISTIAVSTFLMVFLIQFSIGFILDIWGPNDLGSYPKVAYNYAFGMLVIIEVIFFSWMLVNIRKLKINF